MWSSMCQVLAPHQQGDTGDGAWLLPSGSCCLAFPILGSSLCLLFELPIISVAGCMLSWKVWSLESHHYDSFPASAYLNRAPYGALPLCTIFLTTTPCANIRLLNDLISCFWLKQLSHIGVTGSIWLEELQETVQPSSRSHRLRMKIAKGN